VGSARDDRRQDQITEAFNETITFAFDEWCNNSTEEECRHKTDAALEEAMKEAYQFMMNCGDGTTCQNETENAIDGFLQDEKAVEAAGHMLNDVREFTG